MDAFSIQFPTLDMFVEGWDSKGCVLLRRFSLGQPETQALHAPHGPGYVGHSTWGCG